MNAGTDKSRTETRWQPIATAPKDGTRVLLAEYEVSRHWPEDSRWYFWEDHWRLYASGLGEGWGRASNPTHWIPLPAPPENDDA